MKMSIEQYLKIKNLHIEKYKTVTSTNDILAQKAKEGAPSGTVIVAEHQSAGRGKWGRAFYSPADTGSYMSILLIAPRQAVNGMHITARAAVAVAKAIEKQVKDLVLIKWMNDIYYRGKKVCGILAESIDLSADEVGIIVGIGVNLREPPGGFPGELRNIAGALFTHAGGDADRLVSDIIFEFFGEEPDVYNEYVARSMLTGKSVSACRNGKELYRARVEGVTRDFGLCLALSDGTRRTLVGGDVSLISDDFGV